MFNAKVAKVMVFECRESFTPANVPPEVLPADGQESWTVVVVGEQEATVDDFHSKKDLQSFIITPSQPVTEPLSSTEANHPSGR